MNKGKTRGASRASNRRRAIPGVKVAPVKLSPQERRVWERLQEHAVATVTMLYRRARRLLSDGFTPEHRKMQQHVGVIVARINKKRPSYLIAPGERPRTYRLTRRR